MEKSQSNTATGDLVPGQAGPPDESHKVSADSNANEPASASLSDKCVLAINYAYKNSTKWTILTGRLLLDAKAQLPHGQWMFEKSRVKFSLRSAETLMAIARNPALCNSKNLSNLPQAASVLYVLSHLPAEVLEQAILKGVVHPGLALAEARHILESHKANLATAPADRTPQPVVHRVQLANLLEAMAKELRTPGKE